jgi:hypothetical protein
LNRRGLLLATILLAAAGDAQAQDQCGLLNPERCGLTAEARQGFRQIADAVGASAPIARVAAATVRNLIGDLNMTFKSFDTEDALTNGVGFDYDWNKRFTRFVLPDNSANVSAFSWGIDASGNVAFDASTNPRDFLQTATTLGWMFSRGGVARQLPVETSQRIQDAVMILADVPDDSIADHPLNQEVLREISQALSTQFFISLDAQVAYESDQSFDQRQLVYGGRLGLDVKAWNPSSALAKLNVLDWPFALLRYMTAADATIRPRGSALPTVLVSLDRVDPAEDSVRARLNAADAYPRVALEAGFRTLAGRVASGDLFAEANVRYYQELGADDAVKQAGIDDFMVFVVALTGPGGTYVSYSTGELPFDRGSDKVYELGFRYRF